MTWRVVREVASDARPGESSYNPALTIGPGAFNVGIVAWGGDGLHWVGVNVGRGQRLVVIQDVPESGDVTGQAVRY